MSSKSRVIIISTTGKTGEPLAEELARSGQFEVIGTVRPESNGKPEVEKLKAAGVDIRSLDWQKATVEELTQLFSGADTVISTVHFVTFDDQTKLIDAAKIAGVKRFVPSDWSTVCPPGEMLIQDKKIAIHDYALKAGVPFTSIAIGAWNEVAFPPKELPKPGETPTWLQSSYGPGNVKSAIIDRKLLGRFVTKIITDPATVNRQVLAHHDELTADEAWALADKYSPLKLSEGRIRVLDEKLKEGLESSELYTKVTNQYMNTMYVQGYNNSETAKKLGYLIAKELYPEVKVQTGEEWAKERYST